MIFFLCKDIANADGKGIMDGCPPTKNHPQGGCVTATAAAHRLPAWHAKARDTAFCTSAEVEQWAIHGH